MYVYTHEILRQIELGEADGLICIDADSVFYNPINENWMKENIHRDDCMVTYLGRPDYTECGYLYFNLKHPDTKKYAEEVQEIPWIQASDRRVEGHSLTLKQYCRLGLRGPPTRAETVDRGCTQRSPRRTRG